MEIKRMKGGWITGTKRRIEGLSSGVLPHRRMTIVHSNQLSTYEDLEEVILKDPNISMMRGKY
jgi:hypothetical protein